jgi:hypothetical protein
MAFNATGILVFLLAIVPGFVAQQARYSITPRSVQPRTVLEETTDYVLNSVFTHGFLLIAFRLTFSLFSPSLLLEVNDAVEHNTLLRWGWRHHYIVLIYYSTALLFGVVLGLVRATLAVSHPLRNSLANQAWAMKLLSKAGIFSFLKEEPVWYEVLRQRSRDELTFVQVRMKATGGFYTGELKMFAIVDDPERQKDIYLVNAFYKNSEQDKYLPVDSDGVLLNFGDIDAVQVIKQKIQSPNGL